MKGGLFRLWLRGSLASVVVALVLMLGESATPTYGQSPRPSPSASPAFTVTIITRDRLIPNVEVGGKVFLGDDFTDCPGYGGVGKRFADAPAAYPNVPAGSHTVCYGTPAKIYGPGGCIYEPETGYVQINVTNNVTVTGYYRCVGAQPSSCPPATSREHATILRDSNLRRYQDLSRTYGENDRRTQEALGLFHCYRNQVGG
jgi:hypothetical protein